MVNEPVMIGMDLGAKEITSFAVLHHISGIRVIESVHMVEPWEDWSKVRSPSRARRRQRQGHRQNIAFRTRPSPGLIQTADTLYGHPETIAKAVRAIADKHRVKLDAAMAEAVGFTKPERRSDDDLLTLDKIRAAQARLSYLAAPKPLWDFAALKKKMDDDIARAFGFPRARG